MSKKLVHKSNETGWKNREFYALFGLRKKNNQKPIRIAEKKNQQNIT